MRTQINLQKYVLRFGDTCLVLSQRLSEWCGVAPELEEDIAISNIALDLLGQARLWLNYAAEIEGNDKTEDQLAFLRDPHEFYNLLLVERPNGNFADTQVRQFFFDSWHYLVLQKLQHSTDATIASIAAKAIKEVSYHLRRSSHWMVRLGDGTETSHQRLQQAIEDSWDFIGEMFEMDELDQEACTQGAGCDMASLSKPWQQYVAEVFTHATVSLPTRKPFQTGGKQGLHTEQFSQLLTEMQFLQRAYPGAEW